MALIYIVEDDQSIREIEAFALKGSGHTVVECCCAAELHVALLQRQPDLVLLDVMLPDEDGYVLIQKLRALPETRRLPVIMVTAKTAEIDKVRGLDLGADDYLTKPFGVMELISRVRALLRRTQSDPSDAVFTLDGITLDTGKHTVTADGVAVDLTFKEFALLHYLLANAGIVLERDQIMNRIWGIDSTFSSRTLDVHIKTLRQKLGSAGAHIRTVRNVGYKIE